MTILTAIILILVSLGIVIYSANLLVDGASALAKSYKIPNIVIGLTIVSFGTSAPEFVVSLFSALSGNSDIAIGNIVGSNIVNIWLILGICAVIIPLKVLKNTVAKEIPLSLLAAVILYFIINDTTFGSGNKDVLSFSDGVVLLGFFVIFMYYMSHLAKQSNENEELEIKPWSKSKSTIFIFLGFLGLVLGGKLFVDQATVLALVAGIPNAIIGLTIVAIGTSLPELATSMVAALKGNADIAIGNVVGSNIFNIFFVLGSCALIAPLNKGSITDIDLITCISASALLLLFSLIIGKYKIVRSEGVLFLILFLAYMGYQISNAI